MFSEPDRAFLERLGLQAEYRLAPADDPRVRLRAALDALRTFVAQDGGEGRPAVQPEVEGLLDTVWRATAARDTASARSAAGRLAHAVRDLGLDGLDGLRATSTALQIRTLVVLAG